MIIPHSPNINKLENRPDVRIFSDKNREKFTEILANIDWISLLSDINDPNTAFENFYTQLDLAFNKSFPIVKLSRSRAKDKRWMTPGLKNSCAIK